MKHFRTFIITRHGLIKAAAAAAAVIGIAGFVIGLKHGEPAVVSVFSDSEQILDEGVSAADKSFDLKGFLSKVLGFDTDKPESIIGSSSAIFNTATDAPIQQAEEIPDPTAEPVNEETHELPSHEEIISASGLSISNATDYSVDLDELCALPLETKLKLDGSPEVLIMHSHTTECYNGDEMSGESERTTNEAYNMCSIGDIIGETLEGYGIGVVHDKTIHDYPTYQGSYTRALNTINSNIEKYPQIQVVLDIHRDAFIYDDGSKLRVAAEINGSDAAKVMLVSGTDSMGLYHPYWRANLSLAAKIQGAANIMYPGLMRSIDLRRERFNMHITKGSLLIEVGSNGNSLAEAKAAAGYIGTAIAAALLNG